MNKLDAIYIAVGELKTACLKEIQNAEPVIVGQLSRIKMLLKRIADRLDQQAVL